MALRHKPFSVLALCVAFLCSRAHSFAWEGPPFILAGETLWSGLPIEANVDPVSERHLVVPGERVGGLRLGDTEERFWELFHRYEPGSDQYTYPCSNDLVTQLHWSEPASAGIFAYLKDGHIFQIAAATPHLQTANGITEDSTPEKVKHFYPNLEAYWHENQRDLATGDRDFIYWVDRRSGIAFEFAYAPDVRRRLVYRIFVFKPGTDFQPEGCVQYPQVWKKIAPYSLEPPPTKRR